MMENIEKKKPKGNVKFNISLSNEQKVAKSHVIAHAFNFIVGQAGSGKTLLAVQIALDMFFKREFNMIIITRPTIATEDNGFLPGTKKEKMEPWLVPIMSNMRKVYNKPEKIQKMVDDAETHAEEDQKRRASIDARNQLDSLIYQTEKSLTENGESLPEDDKAAIETAIADAKKVQEDAEADADALVAAAATLTQSSHKLAEAIYAKTAAEASEAGPDMNGTAGGESTDPTQAPEDEDVVDADFEEVKN